jgi:hypothetical protein
MTDRTDQLIEDAQRTIRIHEGVLALKAERDRLRSALEDIDDAITGLQRDTPIEVLNEIPRLARAGVIQALAHARKLTGRIRN